MSHRKDLEKTKDSGKNQKDSDLKSIPKWYSLETEVEATIQIIIYNIIIYQE